MKNKIKHGHRIIAFLYLVALGLFARAYLKEIQKADRYGFNPDYDAEERVDWWINSANYFKATGIPLMVRLSRDRVAPIENFSLADDRLHPLLAGLLARAQDRPADRGTLTVLALSINAVGLLLLSMVLLCLEMPLSAVLILLIGIRYGIAGPVPGPDSYSSGVGYCALGLSALLSWTPWFWGRHDGWAKRLSTSSLGFLSLNLVTLLRQPVGVIAIAGCAIVWVFALCQQRKGGRSGWGAALWGIFILGFALNVPSLLLSVRNCRYHISPGQHVPGHGVFHSLYAGLGSELNPWGIIALDDEVGPRRVAQIDPTIVFATPRYFQAIRREYFRLWRESPAIMLRIYRGKLMKTIAFPFRLGGYNIYWSILFILILWPLLNRPSSISGYEMQPALLISILWLGLFILQGVFVIAYGKYLYPAKPAVLLILCEFAEYLAVGFIRLPKVFER